MLLVVPSLAVSQTVSFTQDGIWTCPSDVTSVTLKEIGGGSGGIGGYYWVYNQVGGFIGSGNGAGGNAGTYVTQSNIPVTPGQSYSIIVGKPGLGVAGKYLVGTDNIQYYYYGEIGGNSSAFGYIAEGGAAPYISWYSYPSGAGGWYAVTLSSGSSSNGEVGYGNYQIAYSGLNSITGTTSDNLRTSYGSPGGIGYGAGGGGGGAGSPVAGHFALGGPGGNGAYGYVEITYDSSSTSVIPMGYVVDAYASSAISGAVVNVTQSGVTYSVSSGADGSFSMDNASLTYGVPLTIMTNKSGYASDVNTFTPLASGPINLTIPLISTSYYTNTTIAGIVRDSLYGNPVSDAVYSAQDTTTSTIYTDTSNSRGLAIVTGLDPNHFYFVWANKTGYTSPSPVLVKPYS